MFSTHVLYSHYALSLRPLSFSFSLKNLVYIKRETVSLPLPQDLGSMYCRYFSCIFLINTVIEANGVLLADQYQEGIMNGGF